MYELDTPIMLDFNTGSGEHKRFFSTHSYLDRDFYLLKRSPYTEAARLLHWSSQRISIAAAGLAQKLGIKERLKRAVRRTSVRKIDVQTRQ